MVMFLNFIQLSIPNFAFFFMTFFSVSLWEYIIFQRNYTNYPYKEGFAIFSLIQWIAIGIGMVANLGILYGIVALIICMTILQYVCHFSLGIFWDFLARKHYLFPTAIFAVNVWVLLLLAIVQFFL